MAEATGRLRPGGPAVSREVCEAAVALARTRDPAAVAAALELLNMIVGGLGEIDAAERLAREAEAILRRRAPRSLLMARVLTDLGELSRDRDLDRAWALHEAARAIREAQAPASSELAKSFGRLALVGCDRGDLDAAERMNRRALDLILSLELEIERPVDDLRGTIE